MHYINKSRQKITRTAAFGCFLHTWESFVIAGGPLQAQCSFSSIPNKENKKALRLEMQRVGSFPCIESIEWKNKQVQLLMIKLKITHVFWFSKIRLVSGPVWQTLCMSTFTVD